MSWNIAKPGDQINGPVAVTGDLNVDSNTLFVDSANNRVGVLTATPAASLQVGTRSSSGLANNSTIFTAGGASASAGTTVAATFANTVAAAVGNEAQITFTPASNYSAVGAIGVAIDNTVSGSSSTKVYTYDGTGLTERLKISGNGVCTWSNVGGVAGTAMTLNGTGLGIGTAPASFVRFHSSDSQLNTYNYFQNNQALAVNRSVQIVLANGTTAFGANNRDWRVFNVATSSTASDFVVDYWNGTAIQERLRIKSTGQVNFVGQGSDPAGAAAGDVYYNTTTNKLKCYNGTTWNDLF